MKRYDNVNNFLELSCKRILNEESCIKSTNNANKNTIKEELIELPFQFFCIENPYNTIFNLKTFRTIPWWMVGEILTEFLNLNPPLMNKYSPNIINEMYKLTPQGTCEYLYGSRWFEHNQLENIRKKLIENPNSKKCIIQTFMPYDSEEQRNDAPCNCSYMLLSRNNVLNLTAVIRSNDLLRGVKYDYFLASFMLQSIANWCDLKVGKLYFYINSLHVYKQDIDKVNLVLDELKTNSNIISLQLKCYKEHYWNDLRHIKKAEEAVYNGNFDYFEKNLNDIKSPTFRDFTRIIGIKNVRTLGNQDKKTLYFESIEDKSIKKWMI